MRMYLRNNFPKMLKMTQFNKVILSNYCHITGLNKEYTYMYKFFHFNEYFEIGLQINESKKNKQLK